jgi:hypothetical protein
VDERTHGLIEVLYDIFLKGVRKITKNPYRIECSSRDSTGYIQKKKKKEALPLEPTCSVEIINDTPLTFNNI